MISDAISNLADLLIAEAAHDRPLPPERAAAIAKLLMDIAIRAAVLETLPFEVAVDMAENKL